MKKHKKLKIYTCRYTSHSSHSIPANCHTHHVLLLSRQHFCYVACLFSSQLTVCLVTVSIINEFLRKLHKSNKSSFVCGFNSDTRYRLRRVRHNLRKDLAAVAARFLTDVCPYAALATATRLRCDRRAASVRLARVE